LLTQGFILKGVPGKTDRESHFMVKRCNDGKSCGATCISQKKVCDLNLNSSASKSLSSARSMVERVQLKLDEAVAIDKPLETEAEVVQYVKDNYEKWLTGGMDEKFYGGPGQRGNVDAKFWLLGQEGYVEDRYNPKAKENDPVALVNSMRLLNSLYKIAEEETAGKQNVSAGVEAFAAKKAFTLDKDTTVENWIKHKGSSYYGRLGNLVKDLGYSGNLLGANVSSFLQPSGQKGFDAVSAMLKRNGVNVNTFAGGAFKSLDSWYRASMEARLPLMVKGIKRYKPDVVYIGKQAPTDKKVFSNMLLYRISRELKLPVYHVNFEGKDYKYMLIPKAGGGYTSVVNGWHPTGQFHGGKGAFQRQFDFTKDLLSSLKRTGNPPNGVVAKPVEESVMSRVLG
jgi:hypothetical protein